MHCYECSRLGQDHGAVGLCHHCSAALCSDHAHTVADPISMIYPVFRTIVLPKKARLLLCETCLTALEQVHRLELGPKREDAPFAAAVA